MLVLFPHGIDFFSPSKQLLVMFAGTSTHGYIGLDCSCCALKILFFTFLCLDSLTLVASSHAAFTTEEEEMKLELMKECCFVDLD